MMCRDGGADVNFFRLCSLSGRRLSAFCPLHLKRNVNIQESNLWQNVKSAFGGSGWGMVEKCGKGEHRWGVQRRNSVKSYVGAAGCSWELVLFAALLWSCVHWGGERSSSASCCSSVVEVRGGVLCTVTEWWTAPAWWLVDGSSPSLQKVLL